MCFITDSEFINESCVFIGESSKLFEKNEFGWGHDLYLNLFWFSEVKIIFINSFNEKI